MHIYGTGNQHIKTALLMVDGKKQSLRIDLGRGKADDL